MTDDDQKRRFFAQGCRLIQEMRLLIEQSGRTANPDK